MARTRMSWDWVGDQPVFIYTTWIDHNQFHVKVVKGKKGDQNAPGFGPSAEAWYEYESVGFASKNEVVTHAVNGAAIKLKEEQKAEEI